MPNDFVDVLNTDSGERGRIRRNLFESEVFNPNGLLVEVDPTQKPYLPEMYKSHWEDETPETPEDADADEAEAEEED